ncbi:MAG: lysylphosphatidylglycerol synthase transmembrane domain-containing protein [Paracoccaceae bacterium]
MADTDPGKSDGTVGNGRARLVVPPRDVIISALLLLLFVAGLAALAAATGWRETLAELRGLSLGQVAILLALALGNYGMRGLRWHLYTRTMGLGTGLVQDLRHFVGGFAMTATPGRLGELVRMRWIRRETGTAFEKSAPLVLVDRAADLASMGLLLAAALGLSSMGLAGGLPVAAVAVGVAIVVTRPRLFHTCVVLAWKLVGRAPRFFVRARRSATALQPFSAPAVAPTALLLGTVGWFSECYAFYLLLGWMGADIGLWTATAIFLFSMMTGGATGTPGGVGGAEAAMIALLGFQGVGVAVSLPATAIIRLTTLWFAILLGIAIFPVAEKLSKRRINAVE